MARRVDIGILSYRAPAKLDRAIGSLRESAQTDWRLFVIHNPDPGDTPTREVICGHADRDPRIVPVWMTENAGYAGGVNRLFELAETEYIAYCDNDVVFQTPGWDEQMCSLLDRCHEVGLVFPNGGAAPIDRGAYTEILWGVGFCWVLNRLVMKDVGPFDASLGHQEEADYCLRVRMAGFRCAALPAVQVCHAATASTDPASIERINRGVVAWVDKWNRYFNGRAYHYSHPCVTRWDDWPPNALYLEEYWQKRLPGLNASPEVIKDGGLEYDLIKVPRRSGFYRNRVI